MVSRFSPRFSLFESAIEKDVGEITYLIIKMHATGRASENFLQNETTDFFFCSKIMKNISVIYVKYKYHLNMKSQSISTINDVLKPGRKLNNFVML